MGLDVLAIALGALAFAIAHSGGFVLDIAGLAVSFRTPSRTLLWMLIAIAVRVAIDRRTPLLGMARVRLREGVADALDEPAAPGRARRAIAASAGIALIVALILRQQIAQPYAVPDHGDPLFSIWRIAWVLHQLVASPAQLFDANIFFPATLTLTFSDPIIVPALLSAPLLAAGLHPVPAYTALVFGAFWLSGVATYLLVERLTRSPLAAFIAGAMYATAAFRFDHYSHLELQMTFWMPAGLLALHLFLQTARWRYAAALAAAGVLQLYSSMYYAVFFLIYVAAVGGVLLLVRRRAVDALWKPAAACALAAAVLAVPLARPFLAAHPQKGERSSDEVRHYSARPSDFARANKHSAVWREVLLPPEPERALFPGAAPLALGAAGLVPPLGPLPLAYAAGLLVSLDGAFGFNGATYPLLYRSSGIVRGLRAPSRFAALVALTLAILSGFGVARILRRCRGRAARAIVTAVLAVLVVADAWPDLTLRQVWRQPPAIYAALASRPDAVLAEFPVEQEEVFNLPYMYFSTWHQRPMVNGYSGFIPASYHAIEPQLLAFPAGDGIDTLRRRGVTHVTINCALEYTGCSRMRTRMAASPELRLVAEADWEGQPVRLYEIVPR